MRVHVAMLLALGACTEPIVDTDQQRLAEGDVENGDNLNGDNLNGTGFGTAVAWASFENARDGSVHFDRMWIEGSELFAEKRRGRHARVYRGTELVGMEVQGRSDSDRQLTLRVGKVEEPAVGSDIWRYGIEVRLGGDWIPLCLADAITGDGLNGPYLNGDELNARIDAGDVVWLGAIPVGGYWDYRQGVDGGGDKIVRSDRFTFACPQIGAIGKCVEAGYKPWAGLEDAHESCVRLLRADYCGDGTPHTVTGTVVNIYDQLGVQDDTKDWTIEAEWDADGARCVTEHLRQSTPIACFERLYEPTCGDPPGWDSGTLIVSEMP